jgi:hypothetical protein
MSFNIDDREPACPTAIAQRAAKRIQWRCWNLSELQLTQYTPADIQLT